MDTTGPPPHLEVCTDPGCGRRDYHVVADHEATDTTERTRIAIVHPDGLEALDRLVAERNDLEAIVRQLAAGGPRTRENIAGAEECAICGDPQDRHTDPECEWLRAVQWVAEHPVGEQE